MQTQASPRITHIDIAYAVADGGLFAEELGEVIWTSTRKAAVVFDGWGWEAVRPTYRLAAALAAGGLVGMPPIVPGHLGPGRDLVCVPDRSYPGVKSIDRAAPAGGMEVGMELKGFGGLNEGAPSEAEAMFARLIAAIKGAWARMGEPSAEVLEAYIDGTLPPDQARDLGLVMIFRPDIEAEIKVRREIRGV